MSVIWKDGEFLDGLLPSLSADDCGIAGGLGVFDSMQAINGILIDAAEHFARLKHDANAVLGFGESWLPSLAAMTEIWQPLLAKNDLSKGYARLRTVVTGGISQGPLIVSAVPTILVTAGKSSAPDSISPISCAVVRNFPRIAGCVLENCKRLDYTRSFAARREAQRLGADEAILTNTKDDICCGATSNLFIEENGILVTPPLSEGVLAGVTRAKIIEERGAREEPISERRLRAADKIYLTNSFFGMRDVILT